jgi:uncharacterized protein (TIRG00374 family)
VAEGRATATTRDDAGLSPECVKGAFVRPGCDVFRTRLSSGGPSVPAGRSARTGFPDRRARRFAFGASGEAARGQARRLLLWLVTLGVAGSGLLNLYSVIGDGLPERTRALEEIFPLGFQHFSRSLMLLIGFALVVSSVSIYRRKRRAFRLVAVLCFLSVLFHLTKGFDYEEASVSLLLLGVLTLNRKQFNVGNGTPDLSRAALRAAVGAVVVFCYGVAGFWLLDEVEFGVNFQLADAVRRTFLVVSLVGDPRLTPQTPYAFWFARSVYLLTFASVVYAGLAFFRPVVYRLRTLPQERPRAARILEVYGRSSLDFFKLWPDKSYYFEAVRLGAGAEAVQARAGRRPRLRRQHRRLLRGSTRGARMGGEERAMTGGDAAALPATARRARLRAVLGYALAAACLAWVLRDYDFGDLLKRVAAMNVPLVAAAILCDALSYVCQGVRWRLLLRPFGSLSVTRGTQAVYAGLFANEVMPMKPGELVRAYLVSRWMSVRLGTVAASILVERLFDGVWLAAASLLAIIFLPLPHRMVEAGDVFGVAVLILLVLFLFTAFSGGEAAVERATARESDLGQTRRVAAFTSRLRVELRSIVRTRGSISAFALSFAVLLLQALSFWLVMRAYGLRLSPAAGAAAYLVVHLGTVMPGAPANVGTYQFFTVLGLTLFGVDRIAAAGFSLVVFTILTVPLWAIGFWSLGRSGLTLFDVRAALGKKAFTTEAPE